ncbi:hypothetical protein DPMN_076678 [Dreissena polymorpha]|uniref:Secreted protein n=1 Tax=Dreissena polymorpha TaxID=45954 RepID=A0A9D4BNW1_DREPO|nr:hypothetical protein DPMN_076678 [Dreissena polymorpha]
MTQYFTVLVLFVSNLCFLRGIEADERVIDKEELYYRQNVEFANALGYEPYSVIESAIGKQRNKKTKHQGYMAQKPNDQAPIATDVPVDVGQQGNQ